MTAKNAGSAAGSLNNRKAARQRSRAGGREHAAAHRHAPRRPVQHGRGLSRAHLIGGIATILIVVAVMGYALIRSYTSGSAGGQAVANANDLNPAASMLKVGSTAPNFTLRDVNGTAHTLAAQRGHPVLLEFFAVWCPHCQAEAPIMARLTQNYTPKGVRVWSILANPYGKNYEASGGTDLRPATKADLSWFASTFNVKHPQLIDPTFHVVNTYGINAYPGLYVVSPTGKITYVGSGNTSYATLAGQLNKALGAGTQ
jgi:peroxiredoxin